MKHLSASEQRFWQQYIDSQPEPPENPQVEASIAGNQEIADELLELYLVGKKTAGSGLVKDYEMAGDPLPRVGQFWIILNSAKNPQCLVKTVRVEIHPFDEVTEEIAIAEGEGDLSLDYWRKVHREFFTPYLKELAIEDLDKAEVVTEFYEVVWK